MSAREANLAALRRWSDTFRDSGFEAALAMIDEIFDPEVEFSPLLAREVEGRTYHGYDGLRAFFTELNEMLGDVRYEPAEYEPVRWSTDFGEAELSHLNLYDRTVEGLVLKDVPGCTVQYHPEAGPGPHDARHLFDRFLELA